MAVDKITFTDKVSMIESTLPVVNRIRDIDVNEIKDVVNNNADELEAAQEDITTIQGKVEDITRYFNAWGTSITFHIPLGHIAIVMVANAAMYQVWNPNDTVQPLAISGSGITFTRDSSDATKITASKSGNATWTIVVF